GRGFSSIKGLRKRSRDLTQDAAEELHTAASLLGIRPPGLLCSREVVSPMLTGLISPAVVLPSDYQSAFDTPEFRAILLHELTHHSRRDLWWSVAARTLGCLLWPQALLPTLARKLEQSAEESCDDFVLEQNVSPGVYAGCLVRLADRLKKQWPTRACAAGIVGFRSSLGRRVQRIMENRAVRKQHLSIKMRAILASAVAIGTVGALTLVSVRATEKSVGAATTSQGVKIDLSTPELTVRSFCQALSGKSVRSAIECISGADPKAIPEKMVNELQGQPIRLLIDTAVAKIDGDKATCDITGKFAPDGAMTDGKGFPLKETINLVKTGVNWQIVPAKNVNMNDQKMDDFISKISYILSNPNFMQQARTEAKATSCVSNMKQAALSSIMYASDHKDMFPGKTVDLHKEFFPYSKNMTIFTCPETKKYFAFNTALIGKKLSSVKVPSNTVLFYEGSGGKYSFIHGGKTTIALADGHVVIADPKQATKFVWNP
ncbi:MAG: M56 family metallopeptidase, partial [Chthonomonadales bacterium]